MEKINEVQATKCELYPQSEYQLQQVKELVSRMITEETNRLLEKALNDTDTINKIALELIRYAESKDANKGPDSFDMTYVVKVYKPDNLLEALNTMGHDVQHTKECMYDAWLG